MATIMLDGSKAHSSQFLIDITQNHEFESQFSLRFFDIWLSIDLDWLKIIRQKNLDLSFNFVCFDRASGLELNRLICKSPCTFFSVIALELNLLKIS